MNFNSKIDSSMYRKLNGDCNLIETSNSTFSTEGLSAGNVTVNTSNNINGLLGINNNSIFGAENGNNQINFWLFPSQETCGSENNQQNVSMMCGMNNSIIANGMDNLNLNYQNENGGCYNYTSGMQNGIKNIRNSSTENTYNGRFNNFHNYPNNKGSIKNMNSTNYASKYGKNMKSYNFPNLGNCANMSVSNFNSGINNKNNSKSLIILNLWNNNRFQEGEKSPISSSTNLNYSYNDSLFKNENESLSSSTIYKKNDLKSNSDIFNKNNMINFMPYDMQSTESFSVSKFDHQLDNNQKLKVELILKNQVIKNLTDQLNIINKFKKKKPNDTSDIDITKGSGIEISKSHYKIFETLSKSLKEKTTELNETKERLEALLVSLNINNVNSSIAFTNHGNYDEQEVAHKIINKLILLQNENENLLKMISFGNKSSLIIEIGLLKNENSILKKKLEYIEKNNA